MKDLTLPEIDELAGDIAVVVEDMALLGLQCGVIVSGRGVHRVGYSQEAAPLALSMLANAYDSVAKHNMDRAN